MRSCVQHSRIHDGKCLCFPHTALFPNFSLRIMEKKTKKENKPPDFISLLFIFIFICVSVLCGKYPILFTLLPALYGNPGLSIANIPKGEGVGTALLRTDQERFLAESRASPGSCRHNLFPSCKSNWAAGFDSVINQTPPILVQHYVYCQGN